MAQQTVEHRGISIKLACLTFGISQTCYRYQPKLSAENVEIADHLIRLTHNQRNWGVRAVFFVSAQCEGLPMESQAGLSDLPRAGTEPADQTKEADCSRETGAVGGTGRHQSVLVDGFHA